MLLLDVETDMKIYHGMEYIVDISKGFARDILGIYILSCILGNVYKTIIYFWDCIPDAKLTKSRPLVNAIHIAISMDWVSGSF
jgi:hypothetical protein